MTKKSPDTGDLPKTSAPAQRALNGAGITHLEHLTKFTEAEIKKLHGIGPNALTTLRAALSEKGLSFAEEKPKS
jgi:hypothetical protein